MTNRAPPKPRVAAREAFAHGRWARENGRWRARARGLAGLALAATLLLGGALARAEVLPDEIVGAWVRDGQCTDPRKVFVLINASGVLTFHGQESISLERFESVERRGDWIAATVRAKREVWVERLYRREGELLAVRLGDEPESANYSPCPHLPPPFHALHGEGIAAFQAGDAITRACAGGERTRCLGEAFRFADVTGDGRLSVAEIARVIRGVGYMGALDGVTASAEIGKSLAVTTVLGPLLATVLVSAVDYDGDGALALPELLQDRALTDIEALRAFNLQAAGSEIRELFASLELLLRLLR